MSSLLAGLWRRPVAPPAPVPPFEPLFPPKYAAIQPVLPSLPDAKAGLPRVIYSMWLQGEAAAPEIVRMNFRRWASLNPDHRLCILDGNGVDRLLADFAVPPSKMTAQALSDVVRARLLLEGGVWTDASVFPSEPLAAWLPKLLGETDFFAFDRPGEDRPLSSWFLAATPGSAIVQRWWAEVIRFWSKPRSLIMYENKLVPPDPTYEVSPQGGAAKDQFPYFWFHYLFRYLLESDPDFAARWAKCQKLSARPAHDVQTLCAAATSQQDAILRALRGSPVHKLNWRNSYPLDLLDTV